MTAIKFSNNSQTKSDNLLYLQPYLYNVKKKWKLSLEQVFHLHTLIFIQTCSTYTYDSLQFTSYFYKVYKVLKMKTSDFTKAGAIITACHCFM